MHRFIYHELKNNCVKNILCLLYKKLRLIINEAGAEWNEAERCGSWEECRVLVATRVGVWEPTFPTSPLVLARPSDAFKRDERIGYNNVCVLKESRIICWVYNTTENVSYHKKYLRTAENNFRNFDQLN